MLIGRAGRKSKLPFGPFMLTGALTAILFGRHIVDAYVAVTLG
jgi:prepilin signal peptidase PulO-like enzyme (type II secretory pathway)